MKFTQTDINISKSSRRNSRSNTSNNHTVCLFLSLYAMCHKSSTFEINTPAMCSFAYSSYSLYIYTTRIQSLFERKYREEENDTKRKEVDILNFLCIRHCLKGRQYYTVRPIHTHIFISTYMYFHTAFVYLLFQHSFFLEKKRNLLLEHSTERISNEMRIWSFFYLFSVSFHFFLVLFFLLILAENFSVSNPIVFISIRNIWKIVNVFK